MPSKARTIPQVVSVFGHASASQVVPRYLAHMGPSLVKRRHLLALPLRIRLDRVSRS